MMQRRSKSINYFGEIFCKITFFIVIFDKYFVYSLNTIILFPKVF